MGRKATIAAGNVWYEARMEAAKTNDKLRSRFGAADEAGMSEDAIKNTELGLEKQMPVDKAVLLADLYNAPYLLNHYCLHECPIGPDRAVSDELPTIDRVTVKLVKGMRLSQLKVLIEQLVDIAEDGEITEDECEQLSSIVDYMEGIARSISELKNICRKAAGNGRTEAGAT